MDLKQLPIFSNAFLLEGIGSDRGRDGGKFQELQNWCNENCNGRWMVFSGTSFQGAGIEILYCSKAEHISPLDNEIYPQSTINIHGNKVISFEEDTDAMAFKLYFEEPEEMNND